MLVGFCYVIYFWEADTVDRDVIMDRHPFMLAYLLLCLHGIWALNLLNTITFNKNQTVSYGQIFSLASPVPALYSFYKILRQHWRWIPPGEILSIMLSSISKELCFIVTGRQAWTSRQGELNRHYFHWSRRRWVASRSYMCIKMRQELNSVGYQLF